MASNYRSERPTLEQVAAYAKEIGSPTNPERFFRHYSGRNWSAGNGPINDWKAVFRLWTDEDRQKQKKQYATASEYKANKIDVEKIKRILEVFPDAAEGVDLPSTFWE